MNESDLLIVVGALFAADGPAMLHVEQNVELL